MSYFVVYRKSDGYITAAGTCPDGAAAAQVLDASFDYLEPALPTDNSLSYVSNGQVIDRPASPIAVAVNGRVVTLSNVAVGARVFVSGDPPFSVTQADASGVLALTFEAGGTFEIACEHFPVRRFVAQVTLA